MRVYELVYTHMDVPVCVCTFLHACMCGMYNAVGWGGGGVCICMCVYVLICVYMYVRIRICI